MEEHGDGYSAGFGDFAAAREHLSALRVRPVGGRLAQESAREAMSLSSGTPTIMSLGFQHLADADRFLTEFRERLAEVRVGTAPRQDAPD